MFKSDGHPSMTLPPNRILAMLTVLAIGVSFYFFGLLLPQVQERLASEGRSSGYYCGNDLYPIWLTTGELLAHHTTNPYSTTMEHQIETGLYGRPLDRTVHADAVVNYRGFSYPLYTNVLAIPLSLISFRAVQIILFIVFPVLIVFSVRWWAVGIGLTLSPLLFAIAALLVLFSIQVLEGWWALQPTMIVGALLAITLAALRRNALILAGVALALGSIKPQLILLPSLWLTLWTFSNWKNRKRALQAAVVTTIILLTLSELWMPRWWLNWWHQLPAYRQFDTPPLVELLFGKMIGRVLALAALGLAAIAAFRWRRIPADSRPFSLLFAFLLAVGVVFISSSIAVYDQFLLVPGLLILWRDRASTSLSRTLRFTILILSIAFCWPWIVAPLVYLAHLIAPSAVSQQITLLPLMTAASFPSLLLIALCLLVLNQLRATSSPGDSLATF
jgi:glycosyl transferase family 87